MIACVKGSVFWNGKQKRIPQVEYRVTLLSWSDSMTFQSVIWCFLGIWVFGYYIHCRPFGFCIALFLGKLNSHDNWLDLLWRKTVLEDVCECLSWVSVVWDRNMMKNAIRIKVGCHSVSVKSYSNHILKDDVAKIATELVQKQAKGRPFNVQSNNPGKQLIMINNNNNNNNYWVYSAKIHWKWSVTLYILLKNQCGR
jgi:hypothetical protein